MVARRTRRLRHGTGGWRFESRLGQVVFCTIKNFPTSQQKNLPSFDYSTMIVQTLKSTQVFVVGKVGPHVVERESKKKYSTVI